jgi:hypothetical protein
MTGTGNFIFARVLLSELTAVQHASVTFVQIPNSQSIVNSCVHFFALSPKYLLRAGMDLRLELVI